MATTTSTKKKKKNFADAVWDQIENQTLELFGLPNQLVSHNVKRAKITPELLHLQLKSQAVLLPLEEILKTIEYEEGKTYEIEHQMRYIVVREVEKQEIKNLT